MAIVTHIWDSGKGLKTPLYLMDKDHIKAAWKLCWWRFYFGNTPYGADRSLFYNIHISFEVAEKWIPILLAESKKQRFTIKQPSRLQFETELEKKHFKK